MNRWNIPPSLEALVVERDGLCIYCRAEFGGGDAPRGRRASWEHIDNDAGNVTAGNVALCCISCNSSKGAKTLRAWLRSRYCERRAITAETIAEVARAALSAGGAGLCLRQPGGRWRRDQVQVTLG